MSNLYPQHRDCVVSGCQKRVSGRIPIVPMCNRHGIEVAKIFRDEVLLIAQREMNAGRDKRVEKIAARRGDREGSVVYYMQIGDYIKIGFSTRLRQRYTTLRADRLLAIEPGGQKLEHERHVQFAAERIDMRRENFRPSDRLSEHVATLCREHVLPHWATVPPTSVVTVRHVVPKPRQPKEIQ